MIDLNYIHGFFAPQIAQNAAMEKHMLKEYLQLIGFCALMNSWMK